MIDPVELPDDALDMSAEDALPEDDPPPDRADSGPLPVPDEGPNTEAPAGVEP